MPLFKYTAQSITTDEIVTDYIEVVDKDRIADHLYFEGYKLLEVEEVQKGLFARFRIGFTPIKTKDLLLFSKQFQTLLKAGIPLFRSLEIVMLQTQNKNMYEICRVLKAELLEGSSFSDALKTFPQIFPEFFVSMVSVGEAKGNLDEAFANISTYLYKKRELQNKVINALVYPVILICTGLIVVLIMITFVLPRFVSVFIQNEIEMPLATRFLLGVSGFITTYWPAIILGVILSVIGIFFSYHTERGRYVLDKVKLKIPLVGIVLYNMAMTRFSRVLGILYGSGIPLIRAIETAGESMNNTYLYSFIVDSVGSVKDGKGVAVPLRECKQFPPILVEMIGTGEETGTLDSLSLEAADFMDNETEYMIKRLVSMIEPFALIAIGIMVAAIAASFLLPVFKLASSIRH